MIKTKRKERDDKDDDDDDDDDERGRKIDIHFVEKKIILKML